MKKFLVMISQHVSFSILPLILWWLSVYVKGTKQVLVWAFFVNYKFKLKFTVCSVNMVTFYSILTELFLQQCTVAHTFGNDFKKPQTPKY